MKNEILNSGTLAEISGKELKYSMPAAICSYCAGETIVGKSYQMGNVKKVDFGGEE